MTNRRRHVRKRAAFLRWIFHRDNARLVCQLDGGRSFTLSLIPHGSMAAAVVEKFDDGLQAFRRHAAIVTQLRQFGWTLESYGR